MNFTNKNLTVDHLNLSTTNLKLERERERVEGVGNQCEGALFFQIQAICERRNDLSETSMVCPSM